MSNKIKTHFNPDEFDKDILKYEPVSTPGFEVNITPPLDLEMTFNADVWEKWRGGVPPENVNMEVQDNQESQSIMEVIHEWARLMAESKENQNNK